MVQTTSVLLLRMAMEPVPVVYSNRMQHTVLALAVAHDLPEVDDLQICQSRNSNVSGNLWQQWTQHHTEIIQTQFGRLLSGHLMLPIIRKGAMMRTAARRTCGRLNGAWLLDRLPTMCR